MKKIQLSVVALLILGAVACKKTDNSARISANVSNAEAADMVASSVSINSSGIASVSDDATLDATTITNNNPSCGVTKSDSVSRQSAPGSAVTYSYSLKYNYTYNCATNSVPANISSSLIFGGSFSGPNLSSSNSGSTVFTITGLSPTSPDFVINGEYKRNGSFKSKVDTTNSGNSSVDIVVNALTIRRPARTIASGLASISVTGNVPKKGSFSYTGTLVFNGDGTATLTLNGTVYNINLTTGAKTKV